jgi:BirA family biotin operon repressor/biotin-[acetyl-CoA-carboxylase] ligase
MGAEEGLCIVARQQTAGHGRHGRHWVSEKDSGLYFSIILRPKIETKYLSLLTLMTAVVVCDLLRELYSISSDIKWSNDVLVHEKKISGILAETTETNKGLAVILGIGLNLTSANLPPDLTNSATSIEQETGKKPDYEELLNSLTRFLVYFYQMFSEEGGPENIRREWAKRSSYFSGKEVRVILENETIYGTTRGLEDNGALKVKTPDGNIQIVQAGDVEKLRSV